MAQEHPFAQIRTHNEISGPKELDEESIDWLKEVYLNRLKELGFSLTHYTQICNRDEGGLHYLILEHDGKTEYREHWLRDVCEYQDDSQPCSTYSLYFYILYLFIPYSA
jgi:hypothetical protein